MRKILKWIGIVLAALIAVMVVAGLIIHEPKPEGRSGPEADALAWKMLQAVDQAGWDTTRLVRWTFAGMHHYLWDKERNYCRVRWDENEVMLDLDQISGRAWQEGEEVQGEGKEKLIQKAWEYYCNDSFWFNAPVKAFDPGTERRIIPLEDGGEGLMVSYTSGGVTPGDSYLWILDEEGLPTRWKMWVSIIPVGGIESTWDKWVTLSTGARVATAHQTGPITLDITEVKGTASLQAFGFTEDPFGPLEE